MKNTFRIILMTAVLAMSAAAADAQILLGGGGLEPLDRETVITDLSSPAGSGNLFVSISVDYPDGSDSTYYYVTSSYEAACEAAGIELSELTNMMQFTDEGYIRSYLEHFLGRFPKIDLWISLSAEKQQKR
ncbi:MAG TPA: hypothetical protein IAB87_06500 [Candidatus Coprenecus merdipullorum]|nr:hypothetical protein [Candidatus Coprenecus merdipullorum]